MTEGEGPYIAMPRPRLAGRDLVLRAVEPADIEAIRQWRNMQMSVLRQTDPISVDDQRRYFADHVWPEKCKPKPAQILLSIERDNTLIGYGGLVFISWPNWRAEVSFLLAPELERHTDTRAAVFGNYLALLQELAFVDLGMHRLFTETFSTRERHIEVLESAGFNREGRLRQHVFLDGEPTDGIIHGCLATSREWVS